MRTFLTVGQDFYITMAIIVVRADKLCMAYVWVKIGEAPLTL